MAKKAQARDHQWNVIVDAKLDAAARAAASKAGVTLSTWLRAIAREKLGLPTI